jgi:hypothetical protein
LQPQQSFADSLLSFLPASIQETIRLLPGDGAG